MLAAGKGRPGEREAELRADGEVGVAARDDEFVGAMEWIAERAGILEFEAGMPRDEAEREAIRMFGNTRTKPGTPAPSDAPAKGPAPARGPRQ